MEKTLTALAVFLVAVVLSVSLRSPVALVLAVVCGLAYLYPFLIAFLFVAAVLFALTH